MNNQRNVLYKEISVDYSQDHHQVREELQKLKDFDVVSFDQLTADTDMQVALKILARFNITLKECLLQIETGIAKEDIESVWKGCHKIAGSAELVGFKSFGAESRALNVNLKGSTDLQGYLNELSVYLEKGHQLSRQIVSAFTQINDYL